MPLPGNDLQHLDQYDVLGIDPYAGRLTIEQLRQRARAVSTLLAMPPTTGLAAQPVPYTLQQANALRDWLSQRDAQDFTTDRGEREGSVEQPVALTDREIVNWFYQDAEYAGYRFRSTWNPAATPSAGRTGRLNISDPAILVPVTAAPIDLTGASDSPPVTPRQAPPTGHTTGVPERSRRPHQTHHFEDRYSSRASPPPSPPAPTGKKTGNTGRAAGTGRPASLSPPPMRRTSAPTGPPPGPNSPIVLIPPPSTGPHPPATQPYTGPTDFPLATLVTRAGDTRGVRVVVGLVRPVNRSKHPFGAPLLVVTAGLDEKGRLNFRVVNRSIEGRPVTGAGQGNSLSWSTMQSRGLVLLGRFRTLKTTGPLRDFLAQRQNAAPSPITGESPASDRSARLPLDDESPTQRKARKKPADRRSASPHEPVRDPNRRNRSPPPPPPPVLAVNEARDAWDAERDADEAAHESWKYRGGRIRGG